MHGAEAEELRESIENIIQDFDSDSHVMDVLIALRHLLDRVDARDSLAYVEAKTTMMEAFVEDDP